MKILGIFANLTVDGGDGINQQTRQHITSMSRCGFEWSVILFSKAAQLSRSEPIADRVTIVPSDRNFIVLALKSAYSAGIYLLSGKKLRFLRAICGDLSDWNPDLIFVDGLPLAPLVACFHGHPAVLSSVDAMSLRHFRFLARTRKPLAAINHAVRAISCLLLERLFLHRFSAVHVVSEEDATYLRRICPAANITVIPIRAPVEPRTPVADKDRSHIVIWGDVSVPHIRIGLIKLLPRLSVFQETKTHHFTIVGRRAADSTLQQIIDRQPAVTFCEWLPELDLTLARAGAVLLPDDSGTGIKNRAIHAMALGTVVVGTPAALEGIPIRDGRGAFECRSFEAFARAIAKVTTPGSASTVMDEAAASFVREHYSDISVSRQWTALYHLALIPKSANPSLQVDVAPPGTSRYEG